MSPTDILGEILGGGSGGSILKDILARGGPSGKRPPSDRPSPHRQGNPPELDPDHLRQIRELEESLGVGGPSKKPSSPDSAWPKPRQEATPPPLPPSAKPTGSSAFTRDEESLILLRALILAARADGRLGRDERDAMLNHLRERSRDAVEFLNQELNAPPSIRDFCWSVPIGMEAKVYGVSLEAIDLEERSESAHLDELAHGLRIPEEARRALHRRLGRDGP